MTQKNNETEVSRRAFLKISGPITASALSLGAGSSEEAVAAQSQPAEPLKFGVQNEHFSLGLSTDEGLRVLLKHLPTGIELANGRYSFSIGEPKLGSPVRTTEQSKMEVLSVKGSVKEAILLRHEFRFPSAQPWFEEQFMITNRSSYPLDLNQARSGFVLPVSIGPAGASGPLKEFKFTAVPYRREPSGDRKQYADYTLTQVLTEPRSSRLRSDFPLRPRSSRD